MIPSSPVSQNVDGRSAPPPFNASTLCGEHTVVPVAERRVPVIAVAVGGPALLPHIARLCVLTRDQCLCVISAAAIIATIADVRLDNSVRAHHCGTRHAQTELKLCHLLANCISSHIKLADCGAYD